MKCPSCQNQIEGYPAISRKDNQTEICSPCGTAEAMSDFLEYKKARVQEDIRLIEETLQRWNLKGKVG